MTSRDGGRDFTGTCQILTFTYRPNLRGNFARNIFLRSLMRDGHQINHPIGLNILGMIKLTINFSLVKKKSKYLCLKIRIFPNIFIESSSSKEDKYSSQNDHDH